MTESRSAVQKLYRQLESLKDELSKTNSVVDDKSKAEISLTKELGDLKAAHDVLNENLKDLKQKLSNAVDDHSQAISSLKNKAEMDLKTLKNEFCRKENDFQEERARLEIQLRSSRDEIEAYKSKVAAAAEFLEKNDSVTVEELKVMHSEQIKLWEVERGQYKKEISKLSEDVKQLVAEVEKLKTISTKEKKLFKSKLDNKDMQLSALSREFSDTQQLLMDLQNDTAQKDREIERLSGLIDNLERSKTDEQQDETTQVHNESPRSLKIYSLQTDLETLRAEKQVLKGELRNLNMLKNEEVSKSQQIRVELTNVKRERDTLKRTLADLKNSNPSAETVTEVR